MTDPRLTGRQRAILKYAKSFITTNGYPPTIREIQLTLGISSTSVVTYHLGKLETYGYVQRQPFTPRGLRIKGLTPFRTVDPRIERRKRKAQRWAPPMRERLATEPPEAKAIRQEYQSAPKGSGGTDNITRYPPQEVLATWRRQGYSPAEIVKMCERFGKNGR